MGTPEPGAQRAPETPRGTLSRTPPFSGTLSGTLPGTLRARRAGETPVAGGRVFATQKSWLQIFGPILVAAVVESSIMVEDAIESRGLCSEDRGCLEEGCLGLPGVLPDTY